MAKGPSGNPRGRPKGGKNKTQRSCLRDKFLHGLVMDLLLDEIAENKHAAAHLASYLLSGDIQPILKPKAKYVDGSGRTHYWPKILVVDYPKTVDAPLDDPGQWKKRRESFRQTVVEWWNSWLPPMVENHPFFSDSSYRAPRLSPSRILEIYKREQIKHPVEIHTCQWCGHANRSNPLRGEGIEEQDQCRKCGSQIWTPLSRLRTNPVPSR